MHGRIIATIQHAVSGWTGTLRNLRVRGGSPVLPLRSSRNLGVARTTKWREGPAVVPQALLKQLNATDSLRRRISAFLPKGAETPTMLDIRTGPWSYWDCIYPHDLVKVVAFDPLVDGVGGLEGQDPIDKAIPPRRPRCEELLQQFSSAGFDLVFARDWVDRSDDPPRVILEMIRVVKPDCYVLMEHRSDAPKHGSLRPWIFSVNSAGELIIRSHMSETNLSRKLANTCEVECELIKDGGQNWLATRIHKNGSRRNTR
jgi:hypothetical protein